MTRIQTKPYYHNYRLDLDNPPDNKLRFITLRGRKAELLGTVPTTHKAKTVWLTVTLKKLDTQPGFSYGSRKDFGKVGMVVARNVLGSIKRLYPHLKYIYGERVHKSGHPVDSIKLR